MKAHFKPVATLLFFGMATTTTAPLIAAQSVYRCGSAYSDVPCPRATVVDVDDSRSPVQQAAARDVAAREAALAARMSADRERAQADIGKPVKTTRIKAPASAASAQVRSTPRSRTRFRQDNGQGDFVAFVPRPAKK